jgi:PAS domain S-box-containing protein
MAVQEDARAGPSMDILQADCRTIFDAVSDAILIHDGATGEILDVNQGMCQMFGYTPEEARGLKVTALCGGEPRSQLEPALSVLAKAAAGSPQAFEWQARDRAGRVFWVEVHLKPIQLRGQDRVLAVLRDIDRRKQAEEALKVSETRYRMVTESSLAGVYVIREGEFAYVNPTMAQIFGYQPEAIMTGAVAPKDLIQPEDLPLVRENIRRRLSGELDAAHYTFRGRHRDGTVIYCESFGRVVEYQGRPAIVGTLLDITERRRAEEALQTHARVLESMGEGVAVAEADGRIIFANQAFEAMFGYQPGALIGQPLSGLSDFSTSESASFAREMVGQLKTRGILSGEVRNRRKDGTTFFTQARLSALEISGQTCWVLVQEDITERKQVEDALRQSEASYRIVTEGSLAGVYLIQDGLFRYVNPVLAQAFGYTPDELIDRLGPLDLVDPEDRDRIAGNVARRLAGEGEPSRSDFQGLCKDGSVIRVEALSRQVEYQGRPAVMGTLLDVTERRLAEEALKASEEKYRTIFDAINDAIVVMGAETGRFLEVNQKYREMSGYDLEAAKGLTLADVCSAEPPYTFQDAQALMRQAGVAGPLLFEWWAEDRWGRRFWIEINLIFTPLGGQDRLLAVLRDISERKQMEDDRRRAFAELEGVVAERTAGLQAANAQLRGEIDERRSTEAIIRLQRDLALTLSARVELQETLRLCVETAISISGLDSGGVYLVDPVSGDLDLAYHQGLSPEFVQRVAHYPPDSLNAYMVMAGRPLYARLQDLPGIMDEGGLKEGLRSASIIPVIHQDQVIAAINIASHQYEEVPATARAALETLAAQVGSAIARVQAEEALRRAKEDLEIRVAERTAQLKETNESLEQELRVRQTIEQSLRHSEAKYRSLVEQIPAITYVISLAAGVNLLYVSPQIGTLLGFSPEEWLSEGWEPWERQVHPDDRERVRAEIAQSFKSGEQFSAEYRMLAKSGRVVWFRDEARVVYDKEGESLFMQGLALDITEKKQAEEALKETTNTLQAIIHAAPLAILAMDCDLKIRLWNPESEHMFGWKESAVLGGFPPFFQADQLTEAHARLQRQLAGTVESGLELRRVRQDGTFIDTSLWTANLRNPEGEITGLVGILADTTARKRMEETLRQVSRALKAITECHQALIRVSHEKELLNEVCRIIVEVGGYRMAWVGFAENDASRTVRPAAQTGFDEGYVEQLNVTWADNERGRGPAGSAIRLGKPSVVRDTMRDPDFAPWREAARKRNFHSVLGLPLTGLTPSGALTIYASAPNAFDDEEINLLLGLANDLAYGIMALRVRTQQRRAEEALKESERELRLLTAQLLGIQEKERRRVARELHDELGQALTVLKIQLVAIEEQLAPDQRLLQANCEQMLAYIDTVIENVRRLSWDLSPSSLEDLGLSSALGYLVDETCRNHNMACVLEMDEIDHLFSPEIQINIYRIFQESLTNVVKHAGAGRVSVHVKRKDGSVSFMIRDNGGGFNVKQAMSGKTDKRSLGLTAMNERARMARGSLQITSRRGRGTTVAWSIPTEKGEE